MPRQSKATFAVGIFEALGSLRKALIDLVSLGYQQKHLILLHANDLMPGAGDSSRPAAGVRELVIPVRSTLASPAKPLLEQVSFEVHDEAPDPHGDVSLVLNMRNWLPSRHYDNLVEALRGKHTVLFVRMSESRQFAPTCSILLTHCTQQVNTHEVPLTDGRLQ